MKKLEMTRPARTLLALVAGLTVAGLSQAGEVEVLHWWTSGGEAAALDVLKKKLESQGITWKDMPVAGGGGEAAMTALRARVTAGDPPTAVQALGFDITDWAKQGVVGDLGDVANKEGWDKVIRTSLSTTASGSRHPSTCTRPTGSGSPRRHSMPLAARCRRTGTN
jgi:glucose/mannose transport system substrate-binding protein